MHTAHRIHMCSSAAENTEMLIRNHGSQPPTTATSQSSTPKTCDPRVVWLAAACVAINRRGCNVVCVLRVSSDVYTRRRVCLGQRTSNVENIRTVEALISNPNGPNVSVPSVRGSVTHKSSSKERYCRWWVHGPHSPKNTTGHSSAAQHGHVAHNQSMGGSVVTVYSVHVVCYQVPTWYTSGLRAHESLHRSTEGKKRTTFLPVRTYKPRPLVLKPGKLS